MDMLGASQIFCTHWPRTAFCFSQTRGERVGVGDELFQIDRRSGGFAGFTIVNVLTSGGPLGMTHVLATAAFSVGIAGGNFPMGASVSLCMVPILAVAATLILRNIAKRGSEA